MQGPSQSFVDEDGALALDGGNTKKYYLMVLEAYGEQPLMNAIIENQKSYYRGEKFNTKTIDPSLVKIFGGGWQARAKYDPIKGEHTR